MRSRAGFLDTHFGRRRRCCIRTRRRAPTSSSPPCRRAGEPRQGTSSLPPANVCARRPWGGLSSTTMLTTIMLAAFDRHECSGPQFILFILYISRRAKLIGRAGRRTWVDAPAPAPRRWPRHPQHPAGRRTAPGGPPGAAHCGHLHLRIQNMNRHGKLAASCSPPH